MIDFNTWIKNKNLNEALGDPSQPQDSRPDWLKQAVAQSQRKTAGPTIPPPPPRRKTAGPTIPPPPPRREKNDPQRLFQQVRQALDKRWGGRAQGSFTGEVFNELGFDVPTLLNANVIVKIPGGHYELNPEMEQKRAPSRQATGLGDLFGGSFFGGGNRPA